MGESLYHLLGVDREADDAAIRRAYREQVTDHHPDVSDNPDAVDEFKRLTTARDVLLDDRERARYDRVGHDAYVAAELEGGLWPAAGQSSVAYATGPSSPDHRNTSRAREPNRRTRERTTNASNSRSTGGSATAAARSGRYTASARHRYRPPGVRTETATAVDRLRASLGSLGPWLLVHAVFLVTAAGAAGLLTASTGSVPAFSLPLGTGFFRLALFLSALHVVSILYV
jgi:curved DNA-binding protein CbpA